MSLIINTYKSFPIDTIINVSINIDTLELTYTAENTLVNTSVTVDIDTLELTFEVLLVNPIHAISNLIVDLNDVTMLNASGTTATEGQEIYTWSNAITGNGVSGASQTVATKYPLLQTVDGNREVKFDGTNDFLDFGTPTELNFQTGDTFSIVIQLGSDAVDGALYHKGSSSDRQVGIFYFGGWDIYAFNQQFARSTDPVPNVVTHSQYDGNTRFLSSWLNNVIEHNNSSVTGNVVNNLPSLLGARHNNLSGTAWAFFYPGSLRRVLIWDRVLTTEERTIVYNELSGNNP